MQSERHTIREGLIVGLLAYAAVAVFYSMFDLLASRGMLFTVDMLGKAVFRGLRDPSVLLFPSQLDQGAILLYNGLHLFLSLNIGLIVTSLVVQAERHPSRAPMIFLAIFLGGVATVLAVGFLTQPMRPVLPLWSITVANALAALLAGIYLLTRHPRLLHQHPHPPVASAH